MATFLLSLPIPGLLCAPCRSTAARINPDWTRSLQKLTLLCASIGVSFSSSTALADTTEVSGQLRGYWVGRQAADSGPLAQANALQPGMAAVDTSSATAQAELRASGSAGAMQLHASATLQTRQMAGGGSDTQSRFNEAYAAGQSLGWQWSAGKKVVSWDVGYAFRPNDVVQQEVRRSLASETLEGRPLLMAERFDADTAWSLVWINPTQSASATGAQEAALATRVYWRSGAVDWHGFARQGEHTGSSVGAAASWVASDAVELHASLRGYRHADSSISNVAGSDLVTSNPWREARSDGGQQVLIGGTWTSESQISLLVEAWHDDTALTDAQWSDWSARNRALPVWLTRGVPAAAVAGNLAWQGQAFSVSNSLRQDNLFARLSWQHDRWQTALDVLYTPADQGTITTGSVIWSGERFKLEAGLRAHGGPASAVVRQLPVQRQGYVVATWAF
jgi:hypothetical protein